MRLGLQLDCVQRRGGCGRGGPRRRTAAWQGKRGDQSIGDGAFPSRDGEEPVKRECGGASTATGGSQTPLPVSRRASLALVASTATLQGVSSRAWGAGESEIIYDKGAALQGKTLSTWTRPRAGPSNALDWESSSPAGEGGGAGSADGLVASLVVPMRWRCSENPLEKNASDAKRYTWSDFTDPVTGKGILESVEVAITDFPDDASAAAYLDDVFKAGTIEALLGALPPDTLTGALRKADVFRANKRQDKEGVTYYDWELSASPETCTEEERKLLGVCPYKSVTLLAIASGFDKLATLRIQTDIPAFQRYITDIRKAVTSFKLTPRYQA
ncbi:hypothetical protein HOP50_15g74530 [Chloropicon primus]|uniref:PsbP C-terminal domain-containing protein n=2 Tax=Chloropicon primus TaxID=1764295 RepID=A0A5B8MZD9_9CHLO|nr:hypothetical protein A3770_15p74280 [Chloropicon primus]UPR04119.1 hypothetical protein HOP50_15g74530 [Chloropicon primus]|eukprot:QDZ24910.1 hypothetical protein A3770_15p74280 [Chloropicon primus]